MIPGAIPGLIQRWSEKIEGRQKFSPLVAGMYSEFGALNKWVHIWAYKDANERTSCTCRRIGDRPVAGAQSARRGGEAGERVRDAGCVLADPVAHMQYLWGIAATGLAGVIALPAHAQLSPIATSPIRWP